MREGRRNSSVSVGDWVKWSGRDELAGCRGTSLDHLSTEWILSAPRLGLSSRPASSLCRRCEFESRRESATDQLSVGKVGSCQPEKRGSNPVL
ncbi:unnamed protein product [Protopolystoma xenopodis]|uniref:Uncharacterized protein n=1 Tax=Protopolystoma xenopodis TaxID=117903 RepID=A0A448XPN2_9PLAT|nr:unnamed protein product [Protopolystoma xenopodis]